MHGVRFDNPQAFWLLPVVAGLAVLLGLRSGAVSGGIGRRFVLGAVRVVWLALCVVALSRPWKEVIEQRVEKLRVAVLVDRSDSVALDGEAVTAARQRLVER